MRVSCCASSGFNVRQGDLPPGVAVRHLPRLPGLGDSDVSPVARIIEQDVVTGEFDTVQLQLVHPLVWLRVYFHSPTYVSQTALGLGALSLAVNQLGLDWEASVIVRLAPIIRGATFLQAALFLLSSFCCRGYCQA